MAKLFYSAAEAAEKLGQTEDELKALVREGKLREFRDGDSFNYKVGDVDELVEDETPPLELADEEPAVELEPAVIELTGGSDVSPSANDGSSSGSDILLEPIEDSGIDLTALDGSDIVSFEDSAIGGTSSGTKAAAKAKEDTVVPSVGISVFDDAELDEQVDPLAQTAISDVAGLGIDAASSGSGILDLTRESDDTSLGQELLDEIYTSDEESGGSADQDEMGDSTRAGLDGAIPDEAVETDLDIEPEAAGTATGKAPATGPAAVRQAVEYAPDAVSSALTALLVVAVVVMGFAGMGAAAMARGILPSMLETVYAGLWMYAAGATGVAIIASGLTYFVRKRSG